MKVFEALSDFVVSHYGGVLVLFLLILAGPYQPEWVNIFRFESSAIASIEWWRLLSGHFTHASWGHWSLNVGSFLLFYGLFHRYFTANRLILVVAAISLSISSVFIIRSEYDWYVGFSGVLYGLFIYAALLGGVQKHLVPLLLLVGVSAKLVEEGVSGPNPLTQEITQIPVASSAHQYGAVTGLICFLLDYLYGRFFR